MARGENILGPQKGPLFFPVAGQPLSAPENRLGEAVRVAVNSLSVMQKEALVTSARTGVTWRLASDEGAYLDGHDEAPCPLSFFSTGMVSATMNEVLALARQRGINISNIRLIQDSVYTMKGSALKGTMTGGARDVHLEAQIEADADSATLQGLVNDAVAASPISGLLREATESLFLLSHNGDETELGKANAIEGPELDDATGAFAGIAPQDGDWGGVITRLDYMTPKNENTVTYAGGSLAEEQDRLLHVRVFCTLRDDGTKEIIQYLYNPHGTVFRFLSDEVDEDGTFRAPDAATYLAAGIGFCFMTQIGRYAKIVNKPLDHYAIVQDTHFSLGGASGGTGRRGATGPVETHVFLASEHDDDHARATLDMSEQTCFLHALCKAQLKTRVRISRFTPD